MKKLLSIKYSAGAFNFAMLLLRLTLGALMGYHGYDKLIHFSQYKGDFMNWMGLSPTVSLTLVVFAEFFCSIFIILGLFTRLAVIPLIVVMCVVVFDVGKGKIFSDAEMPTLFLAGYLVLLILGPGKVSVDGMIGK